MVDEQQKFSVQQRERMSAHHIVESTATPSLPHDGADSLGLVY